MNLIGTIKNTIEAKPAARKALVSVAVIALGAALLTTEALAAGSHVGGGHAGYAGRAFSGPLVGRVHSLPPIYNSASPYTVPQQREAPVSPGSPGSVFGD
jgi:hypothetical protein